jgi:putative sigma-54 modulation protein
MKITFTGKQEQLTPVQQKKLDAKFAKLSKLIDSRKGEKEAHVFVTSERHLNRAELTVQCFDRAMVGVGLDPDLTTAVCDAVDKLEKQILKLRTKRRDTYRGPKEGREEAGAGAGASAEPEETPAGRVFRVNTKQAKKPMTLDEAVLEMEGDRDYLVYTDAETDRLSVLVRRRDGNFDLVEA